MSNDDYEKIFIDREVNPTSVRLLILKEMDLFPHAFSLTDLETTLDTVDKSTLSRTIHLFHDKRIIHKIDDGSGSMKYSLCRNSCSCTIEDLHVHFSCSACHKTFCLDNISIPDVNLPNKYIIESANFVLKGLCERCSHFAT